MLAFARLRVSLTKHGAHKIAKLLAHFDAQDVLSHLSGSIPGVNIESVQAQKNLSASSSGLVPAVWNKARAAGQETIDALVLIAIIFSHGQLIKAMQIAKTGPMCGVIKRGRVIDGKAFTNFSHTLDELGYCTSHSTNSVSYDLAKIFSIDNLHLLVAEILRLKLHAAGWNPEDTFEQVVVNGQLHEVFSISEHQLLSWLSTGSLEPLWTSKTSAESTSSLTVGEGIGVYDDPDISGEGVDDDEYRLRAIITRRGQQRFRQRLLIVYGRRCVVTQCRIEALLEAAHITPHAQLTDYNVRNGLLLRADIHTLFDLNLLTIDDSYTIKVSECLRKSEYWVYHNRRLEWIPEDYNEQPDRDALRCRSQSFEIPFI